MPEVRALFYHGGVSGRRREPASLPAPPRANIASALDAVEAAVRALESHPDLNAGFGAVLNRSGEIELDAGIADGAVEEWAGVMSVRVRNPISLARTVLEQTPHVLMSGEGAMRLAIDIGAELLDQTTDQQFSRWKEAVLKDGFKEFGDARDVDTVGAVALGATEIWLRRRQRVGCSVSCPGEWGMLRSPVQACTRRQAQPLSARV
jgi:beta-aspartyl-peptidase (threonine type)